MADATLLALYVRRLEQRIAALERLEHGSGGAGLDFDDITGLSTTTLALADEVPVYDVTASGARKTTVQDIWDSMALLTPTTIGNVDLIPFFPDGGTEAALTSMTDVITAFPPSDLLDLIKTVDGAGSGLDADLLDGSSSAAFAAASHTHTTANITDYTTGSITPGLRFGGGNTGMTFSSAPNGVYIKIGTLCWFTLQMILSDNGSSSGAATIIDLPFTSGGTFTVPFNIQIFAATLTGDLIPTATLGPGATTIVLSVIDAGTLASMTETHIGNTTGIRISGMYRTT
jgi:hypothetical protein